MQQELLQRIDNVFDFSLTSKRANHNETQTNGYSWLAPAHVKPWTQQEDELLATLTTPTQRRS